MTNKFRIEKDLLGSMEVAQANYYGIQTQRAINNFQLSGKTLSQYPELIAALANIKVACAQANNRLGDLSDEKAEAIKTAKDKIISGQLDLQFPIDMIQGGAGTSTNMNINEVIANLGLEALGKQKGHYRYLHPNNDVNMSQSTNDVYPSAVRLSILLRQKPLLNELSLLVNALSNKGEEFSGVIKLARTQLQDAVPMTLGQEFKGFANNFQSDIALIQSISQQLTVINIGGTAVGTGINTKAGYGQLAIANLSKLTGIEFSQASNLVDASSDMGAFVIYSSALKRLAIKLSKTANDLRLLSMGPRAGISEISLPSRQPGSSIMPGKVNPVIPEAVSQCSYQVIGNDLAITMAAEAGQLQLNAMEPLIAVNILDSISLLTRAMRMFRELCINGIQANEQRCSYLLENSLGLLTALNPYLGYEVSSSIAKRALNDNESIIEIIKKDNLLTQEQLSDVFNLEKMTQPF